MGLGEEVQEASAMGKPVEPLNIGQRIRRRVVRYLRKRGTLMAVLDVVMFTNRLARALEFLLHFVGS